MRLVLMLSLIISSVCWGATSSKFDIKWKVIDEDDNGVKVSVGKIKGEKFMAFAGVATFNSSVEKITSIILDEKMSKKWIGNFVRKVLLKTNNYDKFVLYHEAHAIWPVSHRGFMYSLNLETKVPTKRTTIRLKNYTESDATALWNKAKVGEDVVKGILYESYYDIIPMGNGKTQIEASIVLDPMGYVPKWIVNIIQRSWPRKTLVALRKIAEDKNYKITDNAKKYFDSLNKKK